MAGIGMLSPEKEKNGKKYESKAWPALRTIHNVVSRRRPQNAVNHCTTLLLASGVLGRGEGIQRL